MEEFTSETKGNLLLIFVKNREEGKVKTRLAKDVGNKKALEIYDYLLEHTKKVALELSCFRMVMYSNFIDFDDLFNNQYFLKDEQYQGDLGERMLHAFSENFEEGYENIVCIGSDCLEITANILSEAFGKLKHNDVVLGPALDGGYYLIGMKKIYSQLFLQKEWGSSNVMLDTILDLKNLGVSYELLDTLRDVDYIHDLNDTLKNLL